MKPLALPLPFERVPDSPSKPRVVRPAEAPSPAKRKLARRGTVWLAVHLPGWPLYAALSTLSDAERSTLESQPLAVVDGDRRATVIACNPTAMTSGIRTGHSLNTAIALAATMQFLPRNPTREVELLKEIAALCERYTSAVSLQPPNELLLEVRGSLRLFGGITAFVERIRQDFKQRGFTPQLAMCSTTHGALWLARATRETKVVGPRDLIPAVARLPVAVLLWPTEIELRLARFGIASIGDLLRLPRGGLARRIGYERLAELDRAVGRHPEVRQYFRTAERYHDPVLLDFEIETTGLLSVVVEKRLQRLQRFLTRRQLALEGLRIELQHREHANTPVTLGLAAATADMAHVTRLMQEQLGRLQLPAPVIAFTVGVRRLLPAPSATRELFSSASSADATIATAQSQARLLEQLRSRLGDLAIQSLSTHADHRPEYAHRATPAKLEAAPACCGLPDVLPPRPLWLLPQPRPVDTDALRTGQEDRRVGPEKIENGWWDGNYVARDYYRVRSPRGALGWLYRDRTHAGAWHLHGLFG
jgi:protein ImuB